MNTPGKGIAVDLFEHAFRNRPGSDDFFRRQNPADEASPAETKTGQVGLARIRSRMRRTSDRGESTGLLNA